MRIFLGLRNWRRGFCGGVECLISTLSFLAALSVFLWRSEFSFGALSFLSARSVFSRRSEFSCGALSFFSCRLDISHGVAAALRAAHWVAMHASHVSLGLTLDFHFVFRLIFVLQFDFWVQLCVP